jgi:hypothetical protein
LGTPEDFGDPRGGKRRGSEIIQLMFRLFVAWSAVVTTTPDNRNKDNHEPELHNTRWACPFVGF